jgi:hypothetical protein
MGSAARTLHSLWRLTRGRLEDGWRRLAAAREMAALDEHERARILDEAGLAQRDFHAATRTPLVSLDLLSAGIRAVGADPDAIHSRHGAWTRDMQRVCMVCSARGRCRRDLATSDFARRYHLYCPNAASLAPIAADARRPGAPTAVQASPHPGSTARG